MPVWNEDENKELETTSTSSIEYPEGYGSEYLLNEDTNVKEDKIIRRHRSNSSIAFDFDFAVNGKQNYSDNAQIHKRQRRSSRRLSKKLKLFVEFDSANGQNLWKETQSMPYHQKFGLISYFQQSKDCMDGLVSMAICFNAKTTALYHHDDDEEDYDEDEELFQLTEQQMTALYAKYYADEHANSLPELSTICSRGMTLDETSEILKIFGCKAVSVRYTYELKMDEFRVLIKDVLKGGSRDNDKCLFVNYDLMKLGMGIANGHIGLVSGYNTKNDMVLLMDTIWNVGKVWVPSVLLYEAMNTIDDVAAKYRGCIEVAGIPMFKEDDL